ncbi:SAM-dependent methyltransferase [Parendozoicomonas haliclonae]|uniref:Erythromycin 3''-O-methyltransferase n=1 Tax=Parendozoicomonas haliclonae TaxID=1960125 RepID=A0A1X7AGC8_9GAMM|nr:class I SAM-dependent methyltransferase [Parendozoicomonas haliclonae]SMA38312.1 Erythromycin 3''-O-methyltransferase [Parendozoicomonas haliclonae]
MEFKALYLLFFVLVMALFLYIRTKKNSSNNEFHSLDDFVLNIQRESSWANLGYWKNSTQYPDAARHLATLLGNQLGLSPEHNVLDVGYGCGDQILLWKNDYRVASVVGYNNSTIQTQYSMSLCKGLGDVILLNKSAMDIDSRDNFHRVIALDCAYHFPSRLVFLQKAHKAMVTDGQIGLVDMIFRFDKATLAEKLFMRLIFKISHMPSENLWDEATYRAHLSDTNFKVIDFHSIGEWVFLPFQSFIHQHHQSFHSMTRDKVWRKFLAASRVLSWMYKKQYIDMVVVTATKQ